MTLSGPERPGASVNPMKLHNYAQLNSPEETLGRQWLHFTPRLNVPVVSKPKRELVK